MDTENIPAVQLTLDEGAIVALASAIVRNFHDISDILAKHKLTEAQYEILRLNPFFIKVLEAEAQSWNAAANAAERSKVKAALLVESLLPSLNARLHDRKEALEDVIKGAQTLIKIAGIGERVLATQESASQDKFIIQINMGGDQQVNYSKDKTPTPPKIIEGTKNETPPPLKLFVDPPSTGHFFLGGD